MTIVSIHGNVRNADFVVQLLKGLSGFMYGFGSPGGIVNYVTKKPSVTDKQIASVDVGYASTAVWMSHVDLGGRVGPDSMFGYRFNATHEEGTTYNGGNVRRNSFSLATDARITRDLTAIFGALYQDRHASGITTAISTAQYTGTSLPPTLSGGSSTLVTPDKPSGHESADLHCRSALRPQPELDAEHDVQLQQKHALSQREYVLSAQSCGRLQRHALRRQGRPSAQHVAGDGRRPREDRPLAASARVRRRVSEAD